MRFRFLPVLLSFGFCGCNGKPPEVPANLEVRRDVVYAGTANPKQTLDLYLPKAPSDHPRPLVIFIHGGGWESGDKNDAFVGLLFSLIKDGEFAGASVNYRLTSEARWPEQIFDCKAAVRWLRAHAKELNVDPDHFAAFGISAGGHLVTLLGTSGDVPELEGSLGSDTHTSSRVQAVIDFCGVSDLLELPGRESIIKFDSADSCTGKFLGKAIPEAKDLARAASPVTYISKDDPPFLIVHGTKDNLVPYDQATELHDALQKAGVSATMLTGKGGGHVFAHAEVIRRERLFLERTLEGKTVTIPEEPVAIGP
jgi:acetyl esterase/lipase